MGITSRATTRNQSEFSERENLGLEPSASVSRAKHDTGGLPFGHRDALSDRSKNLESLILAQDERWRRA